MKEPSISLKDLPHWFYNWFLKFGNESNFFFPNLKDLFNDFSSNHPKHQNISNLITNVILMFFLGHYQILWIWQWSFIVANRHGFCILVCDLYYKWWPNFEYSEIVKEISKDIQIYLEYNYYVEQEEKAQRLSNMENQ